MRLLLLILTVLSVNQCGSVVGQFSRENTTKDEPRVKRVSHIIEHKREPEYHFGDTKALLYCNVANASGHMIGNVVTWYKNKTLLKNDKHYIYKPVNTLEIDKPKRTDSGLYIARHKIYVGTGAQQYDCFVRYLAKPLVLDFPVSENIQEGETLNLKCVVKGYPPATVTWFKDDLNLKEAKNNSHIFFYVLDEVMNAQLIITNMKRSEAGRYKCVAFSAHFNYSTSKDLLVRVGDKMAAVWPLLGILAIVVLLSLIIAIRGVSANKRIKQEEAKLYRESFLDLNAEVHG